MIRRSIVILFCISNAAAAQKTDTTHVCWRARPAAICKSWIVTEVAMERATHTTTTTPQQGFQSGGLYPIKDFSTQFALTLGGMRNVRPAAALGIIGSVVATPASEEHLGRVEARYRSWTNPDIGLDLSAGYFGGAVRAQDQRTFRPTTAAYGATASVGFSTTYLGADARVNLLRTADGRTLRSSSLALRMGSRLSPVGVAALMLLMMAADYGAVT
jgi:hypothetical protein